MQISSSFNAGLYGLQRASANITEETLNINRQTQNTQSASEPQTAAVSAATPDVTQSLVQLEQQQLLAQANTKSLRTADEMLGSVIDIRV